MEIYCGWEFSWSSDSRWLLYLDHAGAHALELQTGKIVRIEGPPPPDKNDIPLHPAFRPGTHQIALSSDSRGVFTYDLDTGVILRIASTLANHCGSSLCWTHDGRFLVGTLYRGEAFQEPGANIQAEQYVFCADLERRDIAFYSTIVTRRQIPVYVVEDPGAVAAILGGMKARQKSALKNLKSADPAERYAGLDDLQATFDNCAMESYVNMYFDDPDTRVRELALDTIERMGVGPAYTAIKQFEYPSTVLDPKRGWVDNKPEPEEAKSTRLRAMRLALEKVIAEYRKEHGPPVSLDP